MQPQWTKVIMQAMYIHTNISGTHFKTDHKGNKMKLLVNFLNFLQQSIANRSLIQACMMNNYNDMAYNIYSYNVNRR